MQYSISTKTSIDSEFDIKSFSFDQNPCNGGNYLKENPLQLALTQNRYEPMLKLMDQFWKQLTDIKLLPLTSSYYPDTKTLSKKKFTSENKLVPYEPRIKDNYELTFQENLCLRLTQNFQFVSRDGTCEFELKNRQDDKYEMAFKDRYARCGKALEEG